MVQCTWIRDWGEAKRLVRSLKGTFKSNLFRKSFQKGSKCYPFESLVIHDGRRFYGVLTCRYIRNTVAPGVHHVWHIGDVDTAVGTKGYGRMIVEEFIKKHGSRFYLWCWDDVATRFWIHMANSLGLPIQPVGTTPWGTDTVLIG